MIWHGNLIKQPKSKQVRNKFIQSTQKLPSFNPTPKYSVENTKHNQEPIKVPPQSPTTFLGNSSKSTLHQIIYQAKATIGELSSIKTGASQHSMKSKGSKIKNKRNQNNYSIKKLTKDSRATTTEKRIKFQIH